MFGVSGELHFNQSAWLICAIFESAVIWGFFLSPTLVIVVNNNFRKLATLSVITTSVVFCFASASLEVKRLWYDIDPKELGPSWPLSVCCLTKQYRVYAYRKAPSWLFSTQIIFFAFHLLIMFKQVLVIYDLKLVYYVGLKRLGMTFQKVTFCTINVFYFQNELCFIKFSSP